MVVPYSGAWLYRMSLLLHLHINTLTYCHHMPHATLLSLIYQHSHTQIYTYVSTIVIPTRSIGIYNKTYPYENGNTAPNIVLRRKVPATGSLLGSFLFCCFLLLFHIVSKLVSSLSFVETSQSFVVKDTVRYNLPELASPFPVTVVTIAKRKTITLIFKTSQELLLNNNFETLYTPVVFAQQHSIIIISTTYIYIYIYMHTIPRIIYIRILVFVLKQQGPCQLKYNNPVVDTQQQQQQPNIVQIVAYSVVVHFAKQRQTLHTVYLNRPTKITTKIK